MKIERIRPTLLRVTLHTYEWTSLVAASRWALEEDNGDLPPEAREQLEQVLSQYETERDKLNASE